MRKTDRISALTAGSKNGPRIQSIKRKKPQKIAAPDKAQTDSWNKIIFL